MRPPCATVSTGADPILRSGKAPPRRGRRKTAPGTACSETKPLNHSTLVDDLRAQFEPGPRHAQHDKEGHRAVKKQRDPFVEGVVGCLGFIGMWLIISAVVAWLIPG